MILVVGSLNMDLVLRVKRLPRPGETVLGEDYRNLPRGQRGQSGGSHSPVGRESPHAWPGGRRSLWSNLEQEFSPHLPPPFPGLFPGGEVALDSVSNLFPATRCAWRHAIPGHASRTSLTA